MRNLPQVQHYADPVLLWIRFHGLVNVEHHVLLGLTLSEPAFPDRVQEQAVGIGRFQARVAATWGLSSLADLKKARARAVGVEALELDSDSPGPSNGTSLSGVSTRSATPGLARPAVNAAAVQLHVLLVAQHIAALALGAVAATNQQRAGKAAGERRPKSLERRRVGRRCARLIACLCAAAIRGLSQLPRMLPYPLPLRFPEQVRRGLEVAIDVLWSNADEARPTSYHVIRGQVVDMIHGLAGFRTCRLPVWKCER